MILVDSHVHVHKCFHLKGFLDSAFGNFRSQAARWPQVDSFCGVLFLTEPQDENWFRCFASCADRERLIGSGNDSTYWIFNRTNETCSLWARCTLAKRLYIIAGRQIVTAEKLEVLALATDKEYRDGLPLSQTIQTVKENDDIPVVPWGFGKWMGKRGKILTEALKQANKSDFFLGDNGGRSFLLPYPYHFKLAESKGIGVLPGSDPLPFASECRRPGRFGFSVEGKLDPNRPARDIKSILMDSSFIPRPYGSLENPYRFFRNQLAMQLLRRSRRQNLE